MDRGQASSIHVFYQAGYEKHAEFAHIRLDRTEWFMKAKYGVVPDYLLPGKIDAVRNGENSCRASTATDVKDGDG